MNTDLVGQLKDLSKTRHSQSFGGILELVGDTSRLFITSNRTLIASNNAAAVEEGGRYTPPSELLLDMVVVSCGDADIVELFECTKVVVTTATGRRAQPLTYSARPRIYRNAMGASWTARTVLATYRASDLENGFDVTYAAEDGREWTRKVTTEEAHRDLLLVLGSFKVGF